jgi:hypothetical protein
MRALWIVLALAAVIIGVFVWLSGSPACGVVIPLDLCVDMQVWLYPNNY